MLSRVHQALPERRTRRVLTSCLAVAFGLDFVFYTGFYASDDMTYLQGAHELVHLGSELSVSTATLRLGMTLPNSLVYWLTGGDSAAIAWSYVLCHLALVVLAYVIAQTVGNPRAGLIAAAMTAGSPVLYIYAGAVMPDLPTAVWLALLLLMLVRAQRRALEGPLSVGESLRRYFTAGLVLGLSYTCKESGLIMAVACAVVIIATAPRLRSAVWIRDGSFLAAGLVAVMLIEHALIRHLTGEWVSRIFRVDDNPDPVIELMTAQGTGPIERLLFATGDLRGLMPLTFWLLSGSALLYPILKRRKLAVALFFWWPFLYLTIGTISFSRYIAPPIQGRYYGIVILPAAVMSGIVVEALVTRWQGWARRPRWLARSWAGIALAMALGVAFGLEAHHNLSYSGNIYRCAEARAFASAYGQARTEYSRYPLVVGSYFRHRMAPVLYPTVPDDVYAQPMLRNWEDPPPPPFILLSRPSSAPREGLTTLPELGLEVVHIENLRVVHAARRRSDLLADSVRRMLSIGPHRALPSSRHGVAVLQLVERDSVDIRPLLAEDLWRWRHSARFAANWKGDRIVGTGDLPTDEPEYLTNPGGGFDSPPHSEVFALESGGQYLLILKGRASATLRVIAFVIEYDDNGRTETRRQSLGRDPTVFRLPTRPDTTAFRIAIRVTGRGWFALEEVTLAAYPADASAAPTTGEP
jgi:hypothetical protein